jgi:hypothetical protein
VTTTATVEPVITATVEQVTTTAIEPVITAMVEPVTTTATVEPVTTAVEPVHEIEHMKELFNKLSPDQQKMILEN